MRIKIAQSMPQWVLANALIKWVGASITILLVALLGLHMLLPGGAAPSASPLVYGTNLSMNNSQDQFLTNPGAVTALQGLHTQLVRMPIRDSLTSTDYTTALNKIKQMGATPLLIVHGAVYSGGDPYLADSTLLKIAKSIFSTQTVYVDFGNEEDLGGASVQTYTSSQYGWNTEIPKFKQLTGTNFKYGGPVNFQYNESYIDTFVATANPSPDYVVWHAYAGSCGNNRAQDTQASMLASIDNWNAHIQQVSNDFATQNGGMHKGMPMIIDEWNYASDLGVGKSASPCYSNDQTFINAFFSKALTMFIANGKYGVIGAAEYEGFVGTDESMLTGNNTATLQGQAFKASYEANFGSTPTPNPSPPPPSPAPSPSPSPAPTPSPGNPVAATAPSSSQVIVSWTKVAGDVNHYRVQRDQAGITVGTTTQTTLTDNAVTVGAHQYSVYAVNSKGVETLVGRTSITVAASSSGTPGGVVPPVAGNGGVTVPSSPSATSSGTVDISAAVPLPSDGGTVTYTVDGAPTTAQLDTTTLADGTHTIVAQVRQPDGHVITKEQTITVNNHHTLWDNLLLRYGKLPVITCSIVTVVALTGVVGYFIYRMHRVAVIARNHYAGDVSPMPGPPSNLLPPLPPSPYL